MTAAPRASCSGSRICPIDVDDWRAGLAPADATVSSTGLVTVMKTGTSASRADAPLHSFIIGARNRVLRQVLGTRGLSQTAGADSESGQARAASRGVVPAGAP